MKTLVDGGFEGGHMREPYAEPFGRGGKFKGIEVVPPRLYVPVVQELNRQGWRVATHAVGDAAVDEVLDAYEAADKERSIKDKRWTIEHLFIGRPEHYPRIRALGVVVSAQDHLYLAAPSMRIVLPAAAGYILTGMRISLAIALIVTVIAEMVAGNSGIGFYILNAQRSFLVPEMYAGVIALALLGFGLNKGFVALEKMALSWHEGWHAPRLGEFAIFNRSHYEDVLVVRVHELAPKKVWKPRYGHIADFERLLFEHKTIVLKFFLHITKKEQKQRLLEREEQPETAWKLNAGDWQEREYWDDYTEAYEDAIEKTSAKHAPWIVVPANAKWYRNLVVAEAIADALRPYRNDWVGKLKEMGKEAKASLREYRAR